MSWEQSTFETVGMIVNKDNQFYWFKNNKISGEKINYSHALTILQGLVGRKLNSFEVGMLIARPAQRYAWDAMTWSKIVSMLVAVNPDAKWRWPFARTVIGYVTGWRVKGVEANYGDPIQSEAFQLTDGRLIGQLATISRQEPGLEPPQIDPIDLVSGGIASLIVQGGKVALKEGLTEVAEVAFKKPTTRAGLRVLLVGPETEAEFDYARSVMGNGGKVTAVNPVRSPAAERFIAEGGDFVQGNVGSLSAQAEFDIIREDFPYPTGNYIDVGQSAARITRLRPGGAWVVVTEATDYADTLEVAAQLNKASKVLRRMFLAADESAPESLHPRALSRTALVITR